MVAILEPNSSLKDTFYYNENKVKSGVAKCLSAENYPHELPELNEVQKLQMLQKLAALRSKTKLNSIHISLNFDQSEKLSPEQLIKIARKYMEGIGFENQPYLVYEHFDAGHPHVHIVTTNIEANGERIDLHHLGIHKSEPTRKKIEKEFNLVKAEGRKPTDYQLEPAMLQKAMYGKTQTRRAIATVLNGIINTYHYASLNELNAVLGQYNVKADRGLEGSRIYKNNGLTYQILTAAGKPVGKPIKASSFPGKPTLKYLEGRYKLNEILRRKHRTRIKNAVDMLLIKNAGLTLENFQELLRKQGIDTLIHKNNDGRIYGLTYIDHTTKCVFKGSKVGEDYGINAIIQRCALAPENSIKNLQISIPTEKNNFQVKINEDEKVYQYNTAESDLNSGLAKSDGIIELLFDPEYVNETIPWALRRKRKKKKRTQQDNNQ